MPQPIPPQVAVEVKSGALRLVHPARSVPRALPAKELLRTAARAVDSTPRVLRHTDADRAIRLWEGLLQGRWTLVDWFDSEGRRFIIAKQNPPRRGYPRGLTKREREVAMSAALGESSKATGYELGISPSRVSALLKAAMRKLGVRTKAQLVVMVRVLNARQCSAASVPPFGASHNG